MSIRMRFTLLYTAILALTLIFFGATVYTVQAQATINRTQETLVNSVNRLAEMRRFDVAAPRRQPPPPDDQAAPAPANPNALTSSTEAGATHLTDMPRVPFRDQEVYFQVRRAAGEIIFRSANLNDEELPLSEAGQSAVEAGVSWTETVHLSSGRVLVYSAPVDGPDGQLEIVQAARSLADLDHLQNTLLRNLLIAGGIVVAAASGIGWFFSGFVLRPITRITHTAQEIGSEQDFARRVDYDGPRDEVGQLVATFNTMLGQLQGAYSRVEQALQIRRRFVADVSHELRTPLTTIRGNIELLRRVPPIAAEDQSTVINDTAHETDRLIRLVNDLLMLEHSDGVQRLRAEAVPIKPLLEALCQQVGRLAPDRVISCTEVEDVAALGDPDALRQVLLILLDNALTHTAGDVRVSAAASQGESTVISIHDQGPGIPADAMSNVFERFYRGKEARSKPGTGLGLSIAKALVEAQKGTLSVGSSPETGSVFSVRLPRG